MWKIIVPAVLIAVIIIITIILQNRKRKKKNYRMRAAAILVRERRLNRVIMRDADNAQRRSRPIVELSWKDESKRIYLFDPSEPIKIGRDPAQNKMGIRHDSVSAEHCRILLYKGRLVVQDMNSANGTFIRRGMRTYTVDSSAYLKNGDKLVVGRMAINVHLFLFDEALA